LPHEQARDDKSGDHEEHVDTDEPAAHRQAGVKRDNQQNGQRAQALNIEPTMGSHSVYHRASQSLLWSVVIFLTFATTVFSSLSVRVSDILDTPFIVLDSEWPVVALELFAERSPDGRADSSTIHQAVFAGDDVDLLTGHSEIRILLATYATRPRLEGADISVLGTSCSYRTMAGATINDNEMLSFARGSGCWPLGGSPTGELRLTIRSGNEGRIALWTARAADVPSDSKPLYVLIPNDNGSTRPVLLGKYVDYTPPSGLRRADLLAYMWQVAPGPNWIYLAAAAASLLMLCGFALMPQERVDDTRSRWNFALRAALGTGCVAASLGSLYAVVVPPFHAPDEPSHFLAYAAATEQTGTADEAAAWAKLGHLRRLRFHPDERFRPADIGNPLDVAWGLEEVSYDLTDRGVGTRVWLLLQRDGWHLSPQVTLLALRLINAIIFAGAMALATAVAVWLTDAPFPHLLVIPFLLVPSLPFFGMHVSNYAPLVSAYVLFAAGVAITMMGGRNRHYAGLLLGISASLSLAASRSALPAAAMLLSVLAGRILLGGNSNRTLANTATSATVFWGGFGLGLSSLYLMQPSRYFDAISITLAEKGFLRAASIQSFLWAYKEQLIAGMLGGALLIEIGISRLRQRLVRFMPATLWIARGGAILVAAALLGLTIASLFVRWPQLPYLDPASLPSQGLYLRQVALSTLGFFRLTNPDFLLSTSFWAGFGWLDTIPQGWFIVTLTTLTGLALVALIITLAVRGDLVRLGWLTLIGVGFATTLAVYGIAALELSQDLHGRYLLGLYLPVLPICWSLLVLQEPVVAGPMRWMPRHAMVFGVSALLHAYSFTVILSRYF
jgi:hypothetical protein